MASSYTVKGDAFLAEKPRGWIARLGAAASPYSMWDLSPDGKRVAVVTPIKSPDASPGGTESAPKRDHEIVMLLNFFDELRRKVPVGK